MPGGGDENTKFGEGGAGEEAYRQNQGGEKAVESNGVEEAAAEDEPRRVDR